MVHRGSGTRKQAEYVVSMRPIHTVGKRIVGAPTTIAERGLVRAGGIENTPQILRVIGDPSEGGSRCIATYLLL